MNSSVSECADSELTYDPGCPSCVRAVTLVRYELKLYFVNILYCYNDHSSLYFVKERQLRI